MVTCSAADTSPVDAITPWCEAVVAAGVPRVMVVSDDAACVAAAKAAGIKVLQHAFMVSDVRLGHLVVLTAACFLFAPALLSVALLSCSPHGLYRDNTHSHTYHTRTTTHSTPRTRIPLCSLCQVPTISGPLAAVNHLSYRRYAAIQQVLSLGHAAVSVLPEVLLLADPVPLLHQHPTDITVMSTAWADEQMAYGEWVFNGRSGSS